MVRKLYNQNYQKLKRDLQQRGEQFTDPRFPPNASSLFYSGRNDLDIVWKRPGELFNDPRLVVKGLAPSDLNQGELGNCWFVAACSALALEKRLWDKVVVNVNEQEWDPAHPERYAGIFHFHFWQFGEWVDVVVDDWLPTRGGQLVFMKSKDGNEFWSALLEKAYAKLAGSYEALSGGLTADGLVDFTGGVSEVIKLQSEGLESDERRKTLFDDLLQAHEHQAMISSSISLKEGEPPEGVLDCGLVKGHAYTVTDIRRMKLATGLSSLFGNREKLLMIKMRNPWGKTEWNGAWSDNSDEWKRVPKSEQEKMELKVDDDGEFWMEFSDWCQWFTDCSICRIVNTSVLSLRKTWHDATFHGIWQGRSAGGCVNNEQTFLNNPQYSFTLSEEEEIMVSLMQKDPRTSKSIRTDGGKEPAPNFSIGFLIMKIEENRRFRIHKLRKDVGRVTFTNRRSVFGRYKLPQGRYCIVPSTFEPGQEREFLLQFFSERNAHATELKNDAPTRGFCGYLCCCCVKPYRAMVNVEVHNAQGLAKQDMRGAGADPYCKVTCGNQSFVTPIKQDTLDPQFDNQFVFYVKNPEDTTVKVQVMNHGIIRDRFMGQASATLPAADGGGERRTLKLLERGNREEVETQGSVTFTVNHFADLRAM